jgi:hypothetical protein
MPRTGAALLANADGAGLLLESVAKKIDEGV